MSSSKHSLDNNAQPYNTKQIKEKNTKKSKPYLYQLMALFKFSFIYISKLRNNNVLIKSHKKSLIKIRFKGSQNNQVQFGNNFRGNITINCSGNNNLIHIGENVTLDKISINITQNNSLLYIGNNVSIGKDNKISINDCIGHPSVIIDDDCMISSNVEIRTYDSHPIYNLNDEIINADNPSILIAKHTWIGQDVKILKGASIGKGSIIGAGSIVSKSIDANCIAAGIPAKVIRHDNFYWARDTSDRSRQEGKKMSF